MLENSSVGVGEREERPGTEKREKDKQTKIIKKKKKEKQTPPKRKWTFPSRAAAQGTWFSNLGVHRNLKGWLKQSIGPTPYSESLH